MKSRYVIWVDNCILGSAEFTWRTASRLRRLGYRLLSY